MRREFPIISNKRNPELLDKIQREVMPEQREKFEEMFDGEIEKTEEHIRYINTALDLIKKKMLNLGLIEDLSVDLPINEKRIHICSEGAYRDLVGVDGDNELGEYHGILDQVFIKNNKNSLRIFLIMLHEIIHYLSRNVDYLKVFDDDSFDMTVYRSGYRNLNYSENAHEHFRGFNEMVVERIEVAIIGANADAVRNALGMEFSDDDIIDAFDCWANLHFFSAIVDRISKYYKEEKIDTIKRIERGLFTGEMMHLRGVEKAYGKKALRILSYYKSKITKEGVDAEKINSMIERYFMNEDMSLQERGVLGEEILSFIE